MSEAMPDEVKKERHRSPNYPAVGLKEAVNRVRMLYEADGRAGAPAEIAAKHIGFKAAHGSAMSVLAALKKFGLVADIGGKFAPTQGAIAILKLPEADPRRKEALEEAALRPAIYRSLVDAYHESGLPSAEVLEGELTTYQNFNPNAVKGFVKDFLETLQFAEINLGNALNDEDAAPPQERSGPSNTAAGPVTENVNSSSSADFAAMFGKAITRKYPLDISIPRSLKAELTISGEFRQEDLARLKTQIGRLIDNLEDAFSN
jgi:hypothetical protein